MKPEYITDTDWKLLKERYPDNIEEVLDKLEAHYPVQYLIGNVEFLNTIIHVDERVLIPRFETELLVEKTIQKLKKMKLENPNILELGTGSGCISIALKKNIACKVSAVDISEDAIQVARENATLNKVSIDFKVQDMLNINYEGYDLIISNPPYVSETEPVGKETQYEPQNALFAKEKGLFFYQEIIKKISELSTMTSSIEKDLTDRDRYLFIERV